MEVLQRIMSRRRQRQVVSLAGLQRIWTRDDVEQKRKISSASRHRPDPTHIAIVWQGGEWRRCVATERHKPLRRLVAEDAAEKRWHTERYSGGCAQRERRVSGGERPARPARRAAGCAAEVVGIIGSAVDIVIALPVAEPERYVGLAENNATGVLDARDRERVFLGTIILVSRNSPGRR